MRASAMAVAFSAWMSICPTGVSAQTVTLYASNPAITDPEAIAFGGPNGYVYVANFAQGTVALFASNNSGGNAGTGFQGLKGLTSDSAGNVYASDALGLHKLANGSTDLINGAVPPGQIAVDTQGNAYSCFISGITQISVAKVAPNGSTTTISTSPGSGCAAIAVDQGGNVYYVGQPLNISTSHSLGVVTKVTPGGISSQFAAATFPQTITTTPPARIPRALAIDPAGDVYIYSPQSFNAGGSPMIYEFAADGTSLQNFILPAGIDVTSMAFDSFGSLYLADKAANVVDRFSIPTPLLSAVLPGSRSVQAGTAATIFATILNTGAADAVNCQPRLPLDAGFLKLDYGTTDAATNRLTGQFDQPVTIPAKGSQSFILSFSSVTPLVSQAQHLIMTCDNLSPGAVTVGVNTVDLAFSATAVTDVIVLAATLSGDGIVTVPAGGSSAFAMATTNVGVAGALTVSADTGAATLPITVALCQSDPSTAQCLSPALASAPVTFDAGATPTFSVFVKATGAVPFDPGGARIFIRFKDSKGLSHGSTSVAVRTQ